MTWSGLRPAASGHRREDFAVSDSPKRSEIPGPECSEIANETWPADYFNFFTEIEEHFRKARGTGLFLLSPLDWALIENWKNSGIPLEAVLLGIDEAFEKWRRRKTRHRLVNSLAYCAQAVMDAAQRSSSRSRERSAQQPLFDEQELASYLLSSATKLRDNAQPSFHDIAASLESLAAESKVHSANLEALERRLTALEDKMVAIARALQSEQDLYDMRELLDRELSPYRGKMTADQIAMLEKRYLDTAVLERENLPRLSLFYLH